MRHLVIIAIALLCACAAQDQFAEPNTRGVTFGHMHLVVADIELHKKLWTELFNAVLVEKEGYTAVRVPGALVFFRDAEPTAPSVKTVMDHFGFKVKSVSAVLAKWRALGYDVDSETMKGDRISTAFITMPGGVKLELQEDPDLLESTKMGHIHFMTPMRSELMAWYSETFGATAPARGNTETAAEIPGSALSFGDSMEERAPTDGTAIDHIGFEIEEWDEFIEMLKGKGVEFKFGPVYIESLDLWVAFFNDPSGVLVEVTHGLDNF